MTDTVFIVLLSAGTGLWCAIAAINNIMAWRESLAKTSDFMGMVPLEQAPAVDTVLLVRKVETQAAAHAALALILLLQLAAGTALLLGSAVVASGLSISALPPGGELIKLGYAVFCMLWLVFLLGTLWFAGWIKEPLLQLTQIALLLWGLAGYLVTALLA
ncbi:DUF2165 family protein [Qipengyuania qiaonensis]|uniref:DUF2165 family protein n=1 Tax=Qipengyuania qiaonensis TaxID=2867240 RepID=A0ABS7J2Q6_9SPHN|nr:DUF2165 family protein [Qipengyuania qiaonensis]MBX7481599.1 DUF2165 family protein [Qipengyuania qiaonensis]